LRRQKKAAIPAIRMEVNAKVTLKMADFRHSHAKVPSLRGQG
jgi:hypothetical protein